MVTTRSNRRPTSQPAQHERGTTSARGRGRRGRGGAQQVRSTRNQNSNQQSTGNHHERSDDDSPPDDNESKDPEAEIGFTLENFESHLDSWTLPLLRQVLNKRKKNSNRIPPEVQEALNFHKTNYVKIKLMLAILGRVSEKTINSWLGEDRPTQKKSSYSRFLAFSMKSGETPVPPKGCSLGWDERNKTLEDAWKLLTQDEQKVFDERIFAHFSKLPIGCTIDNDSDEIDESGQPTPKKSLSSEEEALYKPLYENLVNHEKVRLVSGQGIDKSGNTPPQALDQVIRLNSELFTVANIYNLTFYMLAATQSPGPGSFCKELSNDAHWLSVAKKQWAAKETFEAYSHGRAIQEVVQECSDTNQPPLKKKKHSDTVRTTLQAELNEMLALGRCKAQFSKKRDPSALVKSNFTGLKILQSEGSKLKAETLVIGLECMFTEDRELWLADVRSGHFKIVKDTESESS
ncbi:hypothetical protein PGT21_015195 [Puccinia graminis f. sp. tritici]|uniref:Uncharacterized protein n=1 Tax=Puccinia graminis f. sp. tritici TaxID=56615 RepID=A0A5B0Q2N5_PUCGR|nr:hypothetical protein PGT21_015195 [Puccinia graminis f. sp. tritici]